MLQGLHLDTRLLQQQNTKKLYRIKDNCVHEQLGQILEQEIQKDQKTQLPILKSREQKQAIRSKSRVLYMPPAHNITKGWAEHRSPDPWTHPYPHPL